MVGTHVIKSLEDFLVEEGKTSALTDLLTQMQCTPSSVGEDVVINIDEGEIVAVLYAISIHSITSAPPLCKQMMLPSP